MPQADLKKGTRYSGPRAMKISHPIAVHGPACGHLSDMSKDGGELPHLWASRGLRIRWDSSLATGYLRDLGDLCLDRGSTHAVV